MHEENKPWHVYTSVTISSNANTYLADVDVGELCLTLTWHGFITKLIEMLQTTKELLTIYNKMKYKNKK